MSLRTRIGNLSNLLDENAEQCNAWHAAGLKQGGVAIEDPPGVREGGGVKMYIAYLRDPAGNKICALHRIPTE